jgi:hypothetical protein
LLPGTMLLFASMVLPKIELEERADLGAEIRVPVRLRDLSFLVNFAALFERRFALPWDAYVREFGDKPAIVRLQPATIRQRTSFSTLQYLVEQAVKQRLQSESGPGNFVHAYLYILNNATLRQWPPAVRDLANSITNDVTRRLSETQAEVKLEPNWKAAYVYSVLTISQKSVETARYRPGAGLEADRLIPHMREHLVTPAERWAFKESLESLYKYLRFPVRFEVLLDELKRRDNGRWFDRLFEATKEATDYELRLLVIELAKETTYANDPQVLELVRYHNLSCAL